MVRETIEVQIGELGWSYRSAGFQSGSEQVVGTNQAYCLKSEGKVGLFSFSHSHPYLSSRAGVWGYYWPPLGIFIKIQAYGDLEYVYTKNQTKLPTT